MVDARLRCYIGILDIQDRANFLVPISRHMLLCYDSGRILKGKEWVYVAYSSIFSPVKYGLVLLGLILS
jgi:hypothetical protein